MAAQMANHEQIDCDRLAAFPREDALEVQVYREYARGTNGRQVLNDAQRRFLEGILRSRFNDNICHLVIATDADRLVLEGFKCEDDAVQTWLDTDLYTKCRLSALSGETHYSTLTDANYCLMPWWSQRHGRIVVFREEWWNGEAGMFVAYDDEDQPKYAVKEWTAPDPEDARKTIRRRTVWYPGQIERYRADDTAREWQPYPLEEDEAWPLTVTKSGGEPLGIPVVHFANGGRGPTNYGYSEIGGGVTGFNDQINDLQYSISSTARMTAFQMVWATGMGQTQDAQGNPVELVLGPGAFLRNPDPAGAFGVIPAGDLGPMIEGYNLKVASVCKMTRTPLHYITGAWPSGEALLRAELPLVDKVTRQREKLTPSWVLLAHRATEIANIYGKAGLNEDAIIEAVWADVEKRDPFMRAAAEQAEAQAVQAWVEASVPLELILKRKGWTEAELDELRQIREAEQADGAQAMDRALTAFEQGR